jgi:hypothetical protein
MLARLRRGTRTRTNPVFHADRVRALLATQDERLDALFHDPRSADLLTWNIFATWDAEPDRAYLAALLQPLAGDDLRPPVRLTLWTGRHREPLLRPSAAYVRHLRDRAPQADAVAGYTQPVEAPIRIESPDRLALVDTALDGVPRGAGGRDRLAELVDAGLEHARYLTKTLVIGVIYPAGTQTAETLSARVNALRQPDGLAAALPWRTALPEVRFHEVTWQSLLQRWEREREHYRLFGQPVRAFLEHARTLGLR